MHAKGAQPKVRRRGTAGADFVLETVFWHAGAARLLKGRTRGPVKPSAEAVAEATSLLTPGNARR